MKAKAQSKLFVDANTILPCHRIVSLSLHVVIINQNIPFSRVYVNAAVE